ncbi:hypothetical protein [Oceanicoccus sp. KOV_DT_Chl]|uniref:hypothetical protein n=1 Tax=Oceanicoccus sp. KOV_DT_Chl TaxID=1904639 RepID=UPI0011AF7EE0|nr:hypothetical protein [Oceanicoccus sp. KOV_DT_Chl]
MNHVIVCLITATLLTLSTLSHAQINMGMVGDSLTDDYLGGPALTNNNLAAGSWGQILAHSRGSDFNFGGYKSVADGTWDNSIRYSGYEYNYATSGGVASDNTMNTIAGLGVQIPVTAFGASYLSAQTAGLAQEISAGNVSTAYVGIGSNDFFFRTNMFDTSGNTYPNPDGVIDQAFIDDVASSILAGVDTLLAAGDVDLLLGLLPAGTAGGSNADILAGITAVNQQLIDGALARGVAIVDLWSWTLDANRVDQATGTVTVGGLEIALNTAATNADISLIGDGAFCNTAGECALDSHALNYAAEDGLHPNTIIQGLLANEMIAALNDNYGHNITQLSDQEILSLAGVSAVPVPAAMWLFTSALLGLVGLKRRN